MWQFQLPVFDVFGGEVRLPSSPPCPSPQRLHQGGKAQTHTLIKHSNDFMGRPPLLLFWLPSQGVEWRRHIFKCLLAEMVTAARNGLAYSPPGAVGDNCRVGLQRQTQCSHSNSPGLPPPLGDALHATSKPRETKKSALSHTHCELGERVSQGRHLGLSAKP